MYDVRTEVKKQLDLTDDQVDSVMSRFPRFKIVMALSKIYGDVHQRRLAFKHYLAIYEK